MFTKAAIWPVLGESLSGKYTSAGDLLDQLKDPRAESQPSQHFVERNRQGIDGRRRRGRIGRRLLASVAILAVGSGVGFLAVRNPDRVPLISQIRGFFDPPPHPAVLKYTESRDRRARDEQIAAIRELVQAEAELRGGEKGLRDQFEQETLDDLEADSKVFFGKYHRPGFDMKALSLRLKDDTRRYDEVFEMKHGRRPAPDDYPRSFLQRKNSLKAFRPPR